MEKTAEMKRECGQNLLGMEMKRALRMYSKRVTMIVRLESGRILIHASSGVSGSRRCDIDGSAPLGIQWLM